MLTRPTQIGDGQKDQQQKHLLVKLPVESKHPPKHPETTHKEENHLEVGHQEEGHLEEHHLLLVEIHVEPNQTP